MMIKLIATDMDGTLLNDDKKMPATIFEVINRLHERDIVFAVASGRNHHSLLKLYDQIKNDIVFIANNGAIMIDKGQTIFTNPINREIIGQLIETILTLPNLVPILSGLESIYIFDEAYLNNIPTDLIATHFPTYKVVKTLAEIPESEQILQVSIFDPEHNSKVNAYDKLADFHESVSMAVSELQWLDIVSLGVNKGIAIRQLQETLKADPVKTMVFGDQMNDYEMMQQAYYSYAMDNAVAEIKAVANFIAPSNEEEGVIRIIENFLSMTDNITALD